MAHTLTKLVCCRSVWKGFSMADVLATGRPCCPSAVGMRQTITVLSMLQDTSMESSGDLSPQRSNESRVAGFLRFVAIASKVSGDRWCLFAPVVVVVIVVVLVLLMLLF